MDQKYYNKLFSDSPSGLVIHERKSGSGAVFCDYTFVDVNSAFATIAALKSEELTGLSLRDFQEKTDRFQFDWAGMYETAEAGIPSDIEFYSDPLDKWFQVHAHKVGHDLFSTTFTDITDYKIQIEKLKKEKHLYLNAINGADVGIWEWNVQTGEQVISERWAEIIGYTSGELEPISIETWKSLVNPQDLELAETILSNVFSKADSLYSLVFRMKHKNGQWIWIESNGAVHTWTPDGKPLLISGSHVDITKRKLAEDALKENERRLETSQEIARVGNWEINLETKEIWASPEAFKIYGIERTTGQLPLQEVQAKVKGEYRKLLDEALMNLISKNEKYDVEFIINNGFTGKELFVHSKAVLKRDDQGKPVAVFGTLQDITEDKHRQDELSFMSYHDQLTGLYNRRFFNEELSRLDTPRNLPLTIVLCDVNGLKLVNDSFGHNLGDELLRRLAKILHKGCRADDIISRYGGDEFAILLPKTSAEETEKVIKRIKELVSKEKIGAFDLSVSFGYETKEAVRRDIASVIKSAEDHMYRHKLYESKSARSKTVDLIINTLYEKNNREMLHSRRVSALCESFAARLNIGKEEVNKIRIAGLMHDIGKIGIDEKILNKRDRLTDAEWDEVKKHSEIGYRILSSVSEFSEVAEFVLEHQEKWDGSGYPKGLAGEEITLEARIITISDAYDAMTGVRTYGRVFTNEEALEEIKRCAGSQFDPQLADAFIDMFS